MLPHAAPRFHQLAQARLPASRLVQAAAEPSARLGSRSGPCSAAGSAQEEPCSRRVTFTLRQTVPTAPSTGLSSAAQAGGMLKTRGREPQKQGRQQDRARDLQLSKNLLRIMSNRPEEKKKKKKKFLCCSLRLVKS